MTCYMDVLCLPTLKLNPPSQTSPVGKPDSRKDIARSPGKLAFFLCVVALLNVSIQCVSLWRKCSRTPPGLS